ncbi:MAG: hypothetical protein WDW36_009431 [Sanguina aurantia]
MSCISSTTSPLESLCVIATLYFACRRSAGLAAATTACGAYVGLHPLLLMDQAPSCTALTAAPVRTTATWDLAEAAAAAAAAVGPILYETLGGTVGQGASDRQLSRPVPAAQAAANAAASAAAASAAAAAVAAATSFARKQSVGLSATEDGQASGASQAEQQQRQLQRRQQRQQQAGRGQLSESQTRLIAQAWIDASPTLTREDRNQQLARRMREAAAGDPFAYDIAKQDGKEYMTGVIDAVELKERFLAVFGPVSGEAIFKEMALLVPSVAKKGALLSLCENPFQLPRVDPLPEPAEHTPPTTSSQHQRHQQHQHQHQQHQQHHQQQQQQQQQHQQHSHQSAAQHIQAAAAAAQSDPPGGHHGEGEVEEGDEACEEDEGYAEDEEADEEDEEADEEGEEEAGGTDVKEMRGWVVLDRSRIRGMMDALAAHSASADSAPAESPAAATHATLPPPSSHQAAVGGAAAYDSVPTDPGSGRPARKLPGKRSQPAAAAAVTGGAPVGARNVLVWLRQDLRVHDNEALCAAVKLANSRGGTATFLYVHSPLEDGVHHLSGQPSSWRQGRASLLWAQSALRSLSADLVARYGPGAAIVYRRGPYAEAISQVAEAVGAQNVYYNRRYEVAMVESDRDTEAQLATSGLQLHSSNALLLREPSDVVLDMSKWVGHFGTLTPFFRARGRSLAASGSRCLSQRRQLSELGLYRPHTNALGQTVDWGAKVVASWDISERAALMQLRHFLMSGLSQYESKRGLADARAVSRLSPYLHWGQLSPRVLWGAMKQANAREVSKTFYRRLVWRDLAYWQQHHWPLMSAQPIRTHYKDMVWAAEPQASVHLLAWQQGSTGFPLVDAGMRELWHTGWMQQNMRMVAATFLVEFLNISWVEGARWFHDKLVDADLAINSMMWQNAGKSGLDQWNFTMSPHGKTQDPTGAYILRWVPELRALPSQFTHAPWLAPDAVLLAAGVQLGATYPRRCTDAPLEVLRTRNVAAVREVQRGNAQHRDARGYDIITIPKGSSTDAEGTKTVVFTRPDYRTVDGPIDLHSVVDEGEEAEVPLAKPVKPSRKSRTQQAERAAQLQGGPPQPAAVPEMAYAGAQQPTAAYSSKQRTRPARRG